MELVVVVVVDVVAEEEDVVDVPVGDVRMDEEGTEEHHVTLNDPKND